MDLCCGLCVCATIQFDKLNLQLKYNQTITLPFQIDTKVH